MKNDTIHPSQWMSIQWHVWYLKCGLLPYGPFVILWDSDSTGERGLTPIVDSDSDGRSISETASMNLAVAGAVHGLSAPPKPEEVVRLAEAIGMDWAADAIRRVMQRKD